jgi:hypothetical protein
MLKKYVDNRHPSFLLGGDGFEIGVKQHNIYNMWDQKKKVQCFFYTTKQAKPHKILCKTMEGAK